MTSSKAFHRLPARPQPPLHSFGSAQHGLGCGARATLTWLVLMLVLVLAAASLPPLAAAADTGARVAASAAPGRAASGSTASGGTTAGSTTAGSSAPGNAQAAQERHAQERNVCMSGKSPQDRATCLREADAALAESRRGRLTGDADAARRNQTVRCQPLPAADRAACLERMAGQGTTSGTAAGGGILRELVTVTRPPSASAPSASQPAR